MNLDIKQAMYKWIVTDVVAKEMVIEIWVRVGTGENDDEKSNCRSKGCLSLSRSLHCVSEWEGVCVSANSHFEFLLSERGNSESVSYLLLLNCLLLLYLSHTLIFPPLQPTQPHTLVIIAQTLTKLAARDGEAEKVKTKLSFPSFLSISEDFFF